MAVTHSVQYLTADRGWVRGEGFDIGDYPGKENIHDIATRYSHTFGGRPRYDSDGLDRIGILRERLRTRLGELFREHESRCVFSLEGRVLAVIYSEPERDLRYIEPDTQDEEFASCIVCIAPFTIMAIAVAVFVCKINSGAF